MSEPAGELTVLAPPPAPAPPPGAAGPVVLAVTAAAGVAAAALVTPGRPGLGWSLAGLAVVVATALSVRWPGTAPPAGGGGAEDTDGVPTSEGRRSWAAPVWAAVALLLLSVGAVRAAGWLFALCLIAAAAATLLAVTAGRTVRDLAGGTLALPVASWRGAGWARRGVAALRARTGPGVRMGRTAALTAAVLLGFGGLLAWADAAFSRLLDRVLPSLDLGALPRWAWLFLTGAALVLGATLRLLAPHHSRPAAGGHPAGQVRLVEWAVPVGSLVLLFAGFVTVQLTVLFGGAAYVLGPDGPTYAEYARSGFWQLLAVTVLTLLVIGVTARVAARETRCQRRWLRGLLGALAVLALVIVASALFRMHTYQEAYGFTRLRVLVSLVELWLGLVFLLALVAGGRLRAAWLPRAVIATGIAAVLALAVLNPDHLIAERNLARWQAGHELDVRYLAGLSADAAPVLVCVPEPYHVAAVARLRRGLAPAGDDWRSANLARATARILLDPASAVECPAR